jgi:hypothetical protein
VRNHRLIALIIGPLIVVSVAQPLLPAGRQSDLLIWREFVTALKKGEITPERLRPYYEELRSPLMGYLAEMREKASWQDCARAAGWTLEIEYIDSDYPAAECVFHFRVK